MLCKQTFILVKCQKGKSLHDAQTQSNVAYKRELGGFTRRWKCTDLEVPQLP